MNHHTCEDHGHNCYICEEARASRTREAALRYTVISWDGNLTIFEIYEVCKEIEDEDDLSFVINYAYEYFSDGFTKKLIEELAYEFNVTLVQPE